MASGASRTLASGLSRLACSSLSQMLVTLVKARRDDRQSRAGRNAKPRSPLLPRPGRRAARVASAVAVVSTLALALTRCSESSIEQGGAGTTARSGLVPESTSVDIRTQPGAALDQVLIDNLHQGLVGRAMDGIGAIRGVLLSKHELSSDGLTFTVILGTAGSSRTASRLSRLTSSGLFSRSRTTRRSSTRPSPQTSHQSRRRRQTRSS